MIEETARKAALLRLAGSPPVIETKIGAAEIGLITENSDEKASVETTTAGQNRPRASAPGLPAARQTTAKPPTVRLKLQGSKAANLPR